MGARSHGIALLLGVVLLAGSALADDSERKPDAPKKDCVTFTTEARYVAYGYDHLVTLHSQCDKRMVCAVKTDVAPTPIPVDIAPNESKTVTTLRGSPAREFKADVHCDPAG